MTTMKQTFTSVALVAAIILALGILVPAWTQDEAKPAASGEKPAAVPQGEKQAAPGKDEQTAPGKDMEELNLKLPKPMFVGTPKNVKSDNLPPVPPKPRGQFFVPKGVTNLVFKKPVTSSDPEPIIGELDQITDGDKEGADGSYLELGPGVQWVQLDLGKICEVYAVVIWHYHQESRAYYDVVVKGADDPDFITNVKTFFNNDHDNSAGLGRGKDYEYIEDYKGLLVDTKGAKTRYLRFYSNGNTSSDMNHYIEIEVYGKPAE